MASRPSQVPSGNLTPAAVLLAAALCAGCAATGAGAGVNAGSASISHGGGGVESLRGEAEITLHLRGRSVSVPGALLLGADGGFRIDLLDPLDRPAAILFTEEKRIVRYRPAAREAASVAVLPAACRTLSPDGWVPFALGRVPRAGEGGYREVRWFGKRSLVKYEQGARAVSVEFDGKGGGRRPLRTTWYCGGESVMKFRSGGGEDERAFSVEYPLARLKVSIHAGELETGAVVPALLFRPPLPAGTRWVGWDLAREEGGGE